jgi:hypothetical protein
LPHPVFKHNDYLGVTTILTQGALKSFKNGSTLEWKAEAEVLDEKE